MYMSRINEGAVAAFVPYYAATRLKAVECEIFDVYHSKNHFNYTNLH